MLGDLFNRAGAAIGTLEAQLRGAVPGPRAPREVGIEDSDHADHADTIEHAAMAAGAAWLASRLLRPRPVSWPRVVLAGVAATLLADMVGRAGEDRREPGSPPFADDPEELLARLGAGVAIAAGYAAVVYPRIPGPPLLRGLAFGALEIAAAPRGGLVRLAAEAPGVKFPLQTLALPIDEDAGPLSHLAYGLGLGLLYRYGGDGDDDGDE